MSGPSKGYVESLQGSYTAVYGPLKGLNEAINGYTDLFRTNICMYRLRNNNIYKSPKQTFLCFVCSGMFWGGFREVWGALLGDLWGGVWDVWEVCLGGVERCLASFKEDVQR